MLVIVIANDHTKITQPHELFKNPDGSQHTLRFLGCGWVDAYGDVLQLAQTKFKQKFDQFVRLVNSQDSDTAEYEALTLLLRGRDENIKFEGFELLRHECLHALWNSLAKCSILSLYLDADSMKRVPKDDAKSKYIISAFQNNNIPSMLHYSLEKRLVEQQIEKFIAYHDNRYPRNPLKQTTYADAGRNNPERQALLTTQRLFYVDMILNKIELAKWSLNEMWGSKAMEKAASDAKVDASIKQELNGLSIEMLRCATSWLIFARHYSAEMDRIKERPPPTKQPKKPAQDRPSATPMKQIESDTEREIYQDTEQAKYKTNSRQVTRKSSWKRR